MRFDPQPNDALQIGQNTLKIATHPVVPTMAFGQEGRKSVVYQLKRAPGGQAYALKVFKAAYQGPYIVEVARRIARYATLPGMAACERTVLTKDKHGDLIRQYPGLEYAVLMPWIADRTWQDRILSNGLLSREQSLALAQSTADVLSNLEARGLAHCDIAGGNVLVNPDPPRVSLVDLEDVYSPDLSPPGAFPAGTAGYQHRISRTNPKGQWFVEGDRFSGAVLLAEVLAWHTPHILQRSYGEHYFAEGELQDATCERYLLMLGALYCISGDVAELFEQAWLSPNLSSCPTLKEWAGVIARAVQAPQALRAFKKAVSRNYDPQILSTWQQHKAVLRGLPEVQEHRSRVDLARRRSDIPERPRARDIEQPRPAGGAGASASKTVTGVTIAVFLMVCLCLCVCLVTSLFLWVNW